MKDGRDSLAIINYVLIIVMVEVFAITGLAIA